MDARHFDALTRVFSSQNSRRRVLGFLATLPVLGSVAGILSSQEAEGKGRGKRHKHGKGKRPCRPETCTSLNSTCGQVSDGCGGQLNCGTCSNPTPLCLNNVCTSCTSNAQCGTAVAPYCVLGSCVPCRTSADCAHGLVCDATAHICTGCTSDAQCGIRETPFCVDEACVMCRTSADCDLGLVCDATTHVCRSCTNASECAPVNQFGDRYCQPLFDGSGQARCTNPNECPCPGTCADCTGGQVCIHTGGGECGGKNLCCPPTPAL
jgi:hypothetical protein